MSHVAVQRQLTQVECFFVTSRNPLGGYEDRQGNRETVGRIFLLQVSRRQIRRDPAERDNSKPGLTS